MGGSAAAVLIVLPAIVYFLPNAVSYGLLTVSVGVLLVGPHLYLRRKRLSGASPAVG